MLLEHDPPREIDDPPESWLPELPPPPRDPRPWLFRHMPVRTARVAALLLIAAMAVTSAVLVSGARVSRQDAGHVGVVRNGGPADNRGIRQVLMPGARLTWIGLFSQKPHEYPAARVVLFYTVTSDERRGDRREVDVVNVPTRDGVQVGIQGTVFFKFVGERDIALLRRFDQTFGTRRFPVVGTQETRYPWDGEQGFGAALDATFRPVLDNDMRRQVGAFACAELVASCKLVRRAASPAQDRRNANLNIASVEARISRSLRADLTRTLGGDYFRDIRVRISHVTLPDNVQGAINQVHARYVDVNGAKAQVRRAGFDAQRNELLAKAYNSSPALAEIDAIKAAPRGATIVLTSGSSGKSPGINVGN
jgi:regulator of protease activity HflC (stomatin/prohibitin superfamily)